MKPSSPDETRLFYRRLFSIMTPILIQNIITNFVGLLDNLMVGQIGTEPMSGVAIVNQLLFIYNLCLFGGMSGAGILTAQFYGRGDEEGVRQSFRLKCWMALGSCAAFQLLFLCRGRELISLFLHKGEDALNLEATLRFGCEYLRVMLPQMLPFAAAQVYASTLRETDETLLPMQAGIAAVFVNLALNYVLIFGHFGAPALGVTGAAYATLLARLAECGIVVLWTHRHAEEKRYIRGVYRSLRTPIGLLRQVAVLSGPLILNETLWSAGMAALNQCYSVRGLEAVSALNISTTVSNLFFCGYLSMGSVVSILIGQHLGAGRLEQAVEEDRKLIAFSVGMSAVLGILLALVAPLPPELYNTSATVKHLAVRFLRISAVLMPFHAFTNACYFTLRSGGKVLITILFDSAFTWCVCVPAAILLSRFTALPVVPLVFAVQGLELVKCVVGFVLVHSRRWVNNLVADTP